MPIYIHQNPNLVKTGGFETLQKSLHSNTGVTIGLSYRNGQPLVSLSDKEKNMVESHYGKPLTDAEFYSNLFFTIKDNIQPLNPDTNVEDLLTYKIGLAQNIVAPNKSAIDDVHCTAIFYVYDAAEQNALRADFNERKANLIYEITKLKNDEPEKIIKIFKYMFESYEVADPKLAYNRLITFIEEGEKERGNFEHLENILKDNPERINLRVDVKEAISRNIIIRGPQGYYNKASTTLYGRNVDEICAFLDMNKDELGEGTKGDKTYSLRRLLKAK